MFNEKMNNVLEQCVKKHNPKLLIYLERTDLIDEQNLYDLQMTVFDELMISGLKDDDEPNTYGFLLEELIDLLSEYGRQKL